MGCGCPPDCDCGCGGGNGPSPGDGDRLNNPSLEQPSKSKGVIVLLDGSGGPDGQNGPAIMKLIMEMMSRLGDGADEAGLYENATEMDGLLGRMAKVAQYEGFVNYWLANGRAFERAWKKKRDKGKRDDTRGNEHNSAHEAWMEVLDEYQDGLLTNHSDFLSKYAKKEVEKAQDGAGSSTTMSKDMTEWANKMKEKAAKEGKTIGEIYSEWLDFQSAQAANQILMERIASHVEAGSAPGVAMYEALDDLTSPYHKMALVNDIRVAGERLVEAAKKAGREDLAKEAQMLSGFWDALTSPLKGWLGQTWHRTKNWFQGLAASGGQSFKLMRSIRRKLPIVVQELEQLEGTIGTSAVNPMALKNAMQPIMQDLESYHALVSPVVALPAIPDPSSPRYQSRVTGGVDAQGYAMLIADLKNVLQAVNDKNSLAYEKEKNVGMAVPQGMKPQAPPEDVRLQKEFENMLDNLNNLVGRIIIQPQPFSAALGFRMPKMIDDSVDQVREPGDFVEYSAKIRDTVVDMIQRQINRSGVMNTINPHSRTMMAKFFEKMKADMLKSIENVLRKRYERKYQHRNATQPAGAQT